jgi:hypothetical protein
MKAQLIITREQADAKLQEEIAEAKRRHKNRLIRIAEMNAKAARPPEEMPESKSAARYRNALEMRRTGKTFREIGDALGVTGGRASQMCERAERMEQADKAGYGLSVRAINTLACALNLSTHDLTPELVARELTIKKLTEVPNAGVKTINEIRLWLLKQHGLSLRP